MDLVVKKVDFLRELQIFQGIVERKNTIPILANVLLTAEKRGIKLLATDLEVALESRCEASVSKPGTITIPAKKTYEIVKALPNSNIRIRDDKGSVKLSADRFESRIQALPKEDFPKIPNPSGKGGVLLPGETLRNMIAKTQFAITSDDTRYFLNGALFVLEADQMSLVATDGHRLALVSAKREKGPKERKNDSAKAILPKKTLGELKTLLGVEEGEESGKKKKQEVKVEYEQSENHLFFTVGSRVLTSRMIDAQFPSYERVIPKNNDKIIEFERDRLTSAVKRVALMSNERSRAIKLQMQNNTVEITSNSPDLGDAREQLSIDYSGDKVEICFNAHYLLDFLGEAETSGVQLEFKDETNQAVMKPVGVDNYDYTYVIMPMRV
jgi:DNA polymerase-3 subunit beta